MKQLKNPINRALVSLLPWMPRGLVWRFSRRYIAGETLREALDLVAALNQSGMSATLDVLGEDSTTPAQAEASKRAYLTALAEIGRRGLDCNISVKLSQMGLRFAPGACREIARELAAAAHSYGNFLRIDMEDSSVTSATLDIYRELRREFAGVGTVIQAYLRRSDADVRALLAEGPTNLRICKGIYVESPEIAFQGREEIRASFRALLARLFAAGAVRVGIATHDPPIIAAACELIEAHRTLPAGYEFQMLLGVAERLRAELVRAGHPLRVYIPYGEAWFAYSYRRLRENPRIAGHIVRNLFRRSLPPAGYTSNGGVTS